MSPDIQRILKGFLPSTEAGKVFDITNDYISQLCRRNKVRALMVGRLWFVEEESLRTYLKHVQDLQLERRAALSKAWRDGHRLSHQQ